MKVTSEVNGIGFIEIATLIYPKLLIYGDITYQNYGLPGPYIHNIMYRNLGRLNIKLFGRLNTISEFQKFQYRISKFQNFDIAYQNFKIAGILYSSI